MLTYRSQPGVPGSDDARMRSVPLGRPVSVIWHGQPFDLRQRAATSSLVGGYDDVGQAAGVLGREGELVNHPGEHGAAQRGGAAPCAAGVWSRCGRG